jgi:hypothetical protein
MDKHDRPGLTLFEGDMALLMPTTSLPRVRWILSDPPWWGQAYATSVKYPEHANLALDAVWLQGLAQFYLSWVPYLTRWMSGGGARCFLTLGPSQWPTFNRVCDWLQLPLHGVWVKPEVGTLVMIGVPLPRGVRLAVDDLWDETLQRPCFAPKFVDTLMDLVPPDGPVGDPFAGSGSVLFAAQRHGYEAVGIEVKPELCAGILARWDAA